MCLFYHIVGGLGADMPSLARSRDSQVTLARRFSIPAFFFVIGPAGGVSTLFRTSYVWKLGTSLQLLVSENLNQVKTLLA